MSYIENTIAVLCGGAAGAVCRFKLNTAIMSGLTMAFPLGILCINVLGGFLMGLLQGSHETQRKDRSRWDTACLEPVSSAVSPPSPPSRSIRLTSTIPMILCLQV